MISHLRRIELQNIRKFTHSSIRLEEITVLVGRNDQGKSSILKILDCIFNTLEEDHFTVTHKLPEKVRCLFEPMYLTGNETKRVTLYFDIPDRRTHNKFDKGSDLVRLHITYKRTDGRLGVQVGEPRRREDTAKGIEFLHRVRDNSRFIMVPAIRDTNSVVFHDSLNKLLRRDVLDGLVPAAGGTEAVFRILKTALESVESRLETKINDLCTGIQSELPIAIDDAMTFDFDKSVQGLVDWMLPRLLPSFGPPGLPGIPITELGNGVQGLLLLAALRSIEELSAEEHMSDYLAVEEPELFLHPHAQREFIAYLTKLSNSGSQILLTTHSPAIIDFLPFERICLVDGFKAFQPHTDDSHRTEINNALLTVENSEILFAKSIMLVEGPSDRVYFQTLLRRIYEELDLCSALHVSVISVGGNRHFAPIVRLIQSFSSSTEAPLRFIVVTDKDSFRKEDGERPIIRAMRDWGERIPLPELKTLRENADLLCTSADEAVQIAGAINSLLTSTHNVFCLPADLEHAVVTQGNANICIQMIREDPDLSLGSLSRGPRRLEIIRSALGSKGFNCDQNPSKKAKSYVLAKIAAATALTDLSLPIQRILVEALERTENRTDTEVLRQHLGL